MIVAALRKKLAYEARKWADGAGVSLPEVLAVNAPPPHVKADLSLPWPLAAAKAAKKNPIELAKSLAEHLSKVPEVESASAAPPGFVNIVLRNTALCANLKAITLAPKTYGEDEGGPKTKVLVEFVSANPTGPLHMASGRGATLGDSLVRIMKRLGRDAKAEYYVNDGGDRVVLLGQSIMARYKGTAVPEKGYQGEYLVDLAAAAPAAKELWTEQQWGRYAKDTSKTFMSSLCEASKVSIA